MIQECPGSYDAGVIEEKIIRLYTLDYTAVFNNEIITYSMFSAQYNHPKCLLISIRHCHPVFCPSAGYTVRTVISSAGTSRSVKSSYHAIVIVPSVADVDRRRLAVSSPTVNPGYPSTDANRSENTMCAEL